MPSSGESLSRHSSEPFLTEAQREALDAALAQKQKNKPEKHIHAYLKDSASASHHKNGHDSLHAGRGGKDGDRKSRMGKGSGRAKKGGAGGKFVWGTLIDDEQVDPVDEQDPNYDSSDGLVIFNSTSAVNLSNYKSAVQAIVIEYFNSGDISEANRCLTDFNMPQYTHWFVKHLIRTAMGLKDREREMASVLLSSLYGDLLTVDQVTQGFDSLIDCLDDLMLDVPNAPQLLALFMGRAIVDDVLPPSYVGQIASGGSPHVAEVRQTCEGHLTARHASERLLRCWGSGAGLLLDETKSSIKNLLAEFKESGDIEEARRCIMSLGVPFYLHELVKQAVTMAMEDAASQAPVLRLLGQLAESGELSQTQISKGFLRVIGSLDDTELDCPNARQALSNIMSDGCAQGWLEKEIRAAPAASSEASNCGSSQQVPAFKGKVALILKEYLSSRDAAEVRRSLEELEDPGLMHLFVKKAIALALDGKHKDRELVSSLIAQLYPDTIKSEQIAMGFTKLLSTAEDLSLDVPEAPHMLSLFLGRVIVDDALPPSFLATVLPSLGDNSLGVSIVQATGSMLAARHGAERLQNCWHGSARDPDSVRSEMRTLLEEYTNSKDKQEAMRCLAELATPHYHHELVKQTLLMAMTDQGLATDLLGLLQELCAVGLVSETQLAKGFGRVESQLEDIMLDIPHARHLYNHMKQTAQEGGWLAIMTTA